MVEHLSCLLHWSQVGLAPRHLTVVQARVMEMPLHGKAASVRAPADLPHVCSISILRFLTRSSPTLFASADGPEPSPTRSQARAPRFHMHPLLSFTRLHHAPISYDIAFTPSARTVVDRTIHAPVPAVTLAQPATEPPIPASSRLVLRSPKLPWTVAVGPIGSPPSFSIGKSGGQRKATSSAALTNLDVLYAVHTTLMTRVTPEEWAALGEGSRAQRRVAEAYKQRCTRMGGGWEEGIRRVDWLGSKIHLVGVEIDKNNEAGENVGRLVFGKA